MLLGERPRDKLTEGEVHLQCRGTISVNGLRA
jgi:hypothetical protein